MRTDRALALAALICVLAPVRAADRDLAVPVDVAAEVLAAEDARSATPSLVRRLSAPSPAVRARVGLALGRIGTPALVAPLIAQLKREPDSHVRAELCLALGLAGRPEATKILVQSLGMDPSPAVRTRAAHALGFVRSPLTVPALLAALPPPGKEIDCAGDELVWQIVVALFRQKDERAVGQLAALATAAVRGRSTCAELARATTWGLARHKSARAEFALRALAGAEDTYVRAWALRGLGDLGKARAGELLPALADPAHLVRAHAVVAAGASKVQEAAPALERIAAGTDTTLAVEAVHALGKLPAPRARRLLERLRVGPGVRARAADLALARLGVPTAEFMDARGEPPAGTGGWTVVDHLGWVEALAAHKDPRARARVKALARLDATPEDPAQVRTAAAAAAFAEAAGKDDLPELRWHLKRADMWVRGGVVEPLAKLGGLAELPAIAAAVARAQSDDVDDFRLAALHAAEGIKEPAATELLRSLLNDPSRNVRTAADAALRERTGRTAPSDPGPVVTGRDAAFYRGVLVRSSVRPLARVTTSAGAFAIRLLPDVAPLTVESFVTLARRGWFDGMTVPRVVPEFVVQIGDPRGDMSGGPGYNLRCEVNRLAYTRGTVGMALSGKDTGGSQWFVMHTRHPHLEGIYTIFGRVESGLDVVDRIAKGDRITSVRIE